MIRIMGLDYGDRTVGVAISDPLGLTAQGKEIVRRERPTKLRRTCARIEELIVEYGVQRIVLGLPVHMDGSEGERAQKTREFKEILERRTGLEVELWDERLTTVAAERYMDEAGLKGGKRKAVVDEIAAVFILQSYLDRQKSADMLSGEDGEEE